MDLEFSDDVMMRIKKHMHADTVVVLDFDDGVGPFSKVGICSLDTAFKLVLTTKAAVTPEFDAKIESNLGQVLIKDYSKEQLDQQMTLIQDDNLNLVLKGAGGILDGHMQMIDLQNK